MTNQINWRSEIEGGIDHAGLVDLVERMGAQIERLRPYEKAALYVQGGGTLAGLIDFMEKRCVGVNPSADAARWELISAHSKSQQRRFAAQGVVTEGPHCPTCECGISVKSREQQS